MCYRHRKCAKCKVILLNVYTLHYNALGPAPRMVFSGSGISRTANTFFPLSLSCSASREFRSGIVSHRRNAYAGGGIKAKMSRFSPIAGSARRPSSLQFVSGAVESNFQSCSARLEHEKSAPGKRAPFPLPETRNGPLLLQSTFYSSVYRSRRRQ